MFSFKFLTNFFFNFQKFYPDHGPDQKIIRTGTDNPDQKIRTTDRTNENPDRFIRTTDWTKKIRTTLSGPRTGPKKSGLKIRTTYRTTKIRTGKSGPQTGPKKSVPNYPDQRTNPDRYGFSVRSGQPCQ